MMRFKNNNVDTSERYIKSYVQQEASTIHGDIFSKIDVITENYSNYIERTELTDMNSIVKMSETLVLSEPFIVGGGYWLEYYTIPAEKYYGPYWYKENGKVLLTWEYSNEENDYTK